VQTNILTTIRKFIDPFPPPRKPAEAIKDAWLVATAEERTEFVRHAGIETVWAAVAAALD
jgi:hypothetical protein